MGAIDYNGLNDRARREFGFTPTIVEPVNGETFQKLVGSDTLAAVAEGRIWVNTDYVTMLEGAGWSEQEIISVIYNVLLHENMHPSNHPDLECPGRFANKLRDAKAVKAEFGFSMSGIQKLLNVVYDAKGDAITAKAWRIYDPKPVFTAFKAKDEASFQGSAMGEFLIAVREEAIGRPIAWFDVCDEAREAAQKVVAIASQPLFSTENGVMYMTQAEKNIDIARIIVKLIKDEESEEEEGEGTPGSGKPSGKPGKGKGKKKPSKGLTEEEKEAIEKALEEAEEAGLFEEAQSAEEAEGDLEGALQDVDLKDAEESELARELLGMGAEEWAFQMVWQDANKKVRFEGTSGKADGPARKVGNLPWSPGMPMRDLDIEDTIINSGRFIPGVTTVRGVYKPGPGLPQPAPVPTTVQFSVDGSGSIQQESPYRRGAYNHDLACASCFAMIRYAQKHKIPVGGNVFADENHRIKTSKDYEAVARDVWKWISRVGGGNDVSGTEPLTDIPKGSLLVYITDFHLFDHCVRGTKDLNRLVNEGVDVAFIALFENHNAAASGLQYMECKRLSDLQDMALKTVRRR
ncbi:hypothetical protein FY034_17190 (plasmid) [Trichlorobacter lovleyi]|uniref:hypothetical protein n=1 Tax=Trichlorobacter lovleyi TaxID=313985 RepID=UPI00223F309F|nr:hypothetical protein [Trichlorobacter lovleyi]QOX81067.1 hypothetical protein FY034_17190 [Trichlorobacter lovleyi]